MKKRIIATALAAVMALSMTACGSTKTADKTYTVGICQLVQHEALDAATQGFKDAMTEALGDKVKFDEQNASNESSNCTTIINGFVSDGVDLILANATPALQAAAAGTDSIPIIGTSVTDYATALQIDDWNGTTGRNISGTCDLAPLDEQAAMIKELFPDAKNIGVLFCSGEPNSKYQSDVITAALEDLGCTVTEYTFADSNDIASLATSAAAESDVIFVPTDNSCASNTSVIDNVCLPAGVPVVASEAGICQGCGIATLSISYYDIGYEAGKMAVDILVNGADITKMEIKSAPNVTKQYVQSRCDKLGITIPNGYEAMEE